MVKGSVPARTDVSNEAFDACGKQGMADLAAASENGTLFGSMAHGHVNRASVKNAIYDVITAHFNGEYDSETAIEELVVAVEIAQQTRTPAGRRTAALPFVRNRSRERKA